MDWNDLLQWIVFIVCAALVLGGALGMTLTMSMYRAGLSLMLCLVAMAGLFVLLEADMLAVIQVMMNVGGMLVMTLFMVMLMQDPGGEMMWDMKRKMQMPGFAALSMFMPPKPKAAAPKNHWPDPSRQMAGQDGAKVKMVHTNEKEEMKMAAQNQNQDGSMLKPKSSDPHRRLREIQQAMAVMQQQLGIMQQQLVALEEELDQPPNSTGSGGMDDMHHNSQPDMSSQGQSGPSAQQTQPTVYTCPMHPEVRSDKPGRCPKCGMDLVPVEGSDSRGGSDEHSGHQTMSGMGGQISSSGGGGDIAGMPGMTHTAGGDGTTNMDMTVASMQKRDPKGYYKMMEGMAMSTGQLKLAGIFSIVAGLVLVFLIVRVAWLPKPLALDLDGPTRVGDLLLSDYMMAFEGAALLILAGIVGAVVLARRERKPPKNKQQSSNAVTNRVAPKQTQDNKPAFSKSNPKNVSVADKAVASYIAVGSSGTISKEVGL